jgi:DNA-binding MarR family transcriptional regulator
MHSRSGTLANRDRTANLLGALALELAHAQQAATNEIVDQTGAAAAALVVIGAAPGRTIEELRRPLGLTQPGATRLVERLVGAGWVERGETTGRRGLQLTLSAGGRTVLDRMHAARRAALIEALAPLSAEQQTQLSEILEALLAARVDGRDDLERLCRLCERRTCDRCPVGGKLDLLLARGERSPHDATLRDR